MKVVFIVDDNDINLMSAKIALEGAYKTYALPSAARMFRMLEKITPDLILLDVEMPEMDGYEAINLLKAHGKHKDIPVIFLTAKHGAEFEIRGFELGASDVISKPFSKPVLIKRIEIHIETDMLIKRSQKALRDLHNATIGVLADMVENRDKVTGGHVERTQIYVDILIRELLRTGCYADEMQGWDLGLILPSAQLHDVGKISRSDIILNKADKLTPEEFNVIKTHTAEGVRIITMIADKTHDDVFLHHAKLFAGYHHEKWDGSGYPFGLKGKLIPLEGRIMAIADVYDAIVCKRPYKEPLPHIEAVQIIRDTSGTHFDPAIADAFVNVSDDFYFHSKQVKT